MRFFIFTKKQLITAGSIVLAVAVATVMTIGVFAKTERHLPIYCVSTEEKKIALSFDAAWGADDTDTLISVLQKYGAVATFFVVGEWVDKYPDEVKKLSDAGHDVMNHSATHPYMTSLSSDKMKEQLSVCNDKIEAITGKKPTLFRCPYGDYNNSVIDTVQSVGMYTIQWDVETLATKVIV
jgi:peptidoglycan/xylan/chitin deacetylase (PgdA/CDA1 family)